MRFGRPWSTIARPLARHCTEAGQIEKAASLWGKAGQRSLERSALVEAVAQLVRALDQIASLPGTPALRREQIKLSVALITPLIHTKGYAAPETKAAAERARLLIEQAEARGEPPEDPLLLFSALYGVWLANFVAFDGDVVRDLAAEFLALAETQRTTVPLMIGHRAMGLSLLYAGDMAQAKGHLDRAIALYDPAEHRPFAMRFAVDARSSSLCHRALALWLLGYADAALEDAERALEDAREVGQAATLMNALVWTAVPLIFGDYAAGSEQVDEAVALADEKGSLPWKGNGMLLQGWLFTLTGKASNAVQTINSAIIAARSTGAALLKPWCLSHLAWAHATLGHNDEAWKCIGEAMTAMATTKERWCEAEIHCVAGEIALISPESDSAKAEAYFERSLEIAREQQAKSWELRAAMTMARLWRDQGKRQEANHLLGWVYGWFTEGFDALDLKQAKALLDTLE